MLKYKNMWKEIIGVCNIVKKVRVLRTFFFGDKKIYQCTADQSDAAHAYVLQC